MSEATLDDRGRLTPPKAVRDRYGDRYRIVELRDGITLIPIDEDPLDGLRRAFGTVDKPATQLRREARESLLEGAGR